MPVPMIAIFISTVIRPIPAYWMTVMSEAVELVGGEVAVATVRERTTRASQVVTLLAIVIPPLGLIAAAVGLWGIALVVGRRGGLPDALRAHGPRHDRRLPPPVHPPELRDDEDGAGDVRDPRLDDDPGPGHAVGHRPPEAPRALGSGRGPPLAARRFRTNAWGALKGFFHAHMGWLFHLKGMERGDHYGKDLYDDRLIRRIDRMYFVWVGLTFALPFAIGYAVGGASWKLGLEVLVWGGLIRIFAYQHATFSVNSICHMFGRRSYRSRDESRNNWIVAALTFGEGWHNNHHAFPASARHGLDRFQLDIAWLTIKTLEKLGLAWNVRLPSDSQRSRRRLPEAA